MNPFHRLSGKEKKSPSQERSGDAFSKKRVKSLLQTRSECLNALAECYLQLQRSYPSTRTWLNGKIDEKRALLKQIDLDLAQLESYLEIGGK